MSYIFSSSKNDLWSPALLAGQLFIATTTAIAQSLRVPNGFQVISEDYIEIDTDLFLSYTQLLLKRYAESENEVVRQQLQPTLLISLALLIRSSTEIKPVSKAEEQVISQASGLLKFMPEL